MNEILCSTGALLVRYNNRDYRILSQIAPKLRCDGFEFMVYSSWYDELDELIDTVTKMKLNIPVIHCQKTLGEKLCAMQVELDNNQFVERRFSPEEDEKAFEQAQKEFAMNLRVAREFGASKMVLHLWNGLVSDKNIEKNIERFEVLNDMAQKEHVLLMVENVICNTRDPLTNMGLVHERYPDISYVFDTKMAEFHGQTMNLFDDKWKWILEEGHIKHLHVNDYSGGIMDWANLNVLPIGKGHVDFASFFDKLAKYGYSGDYTVEATAVDKENGTIDYDMLNKCFDDLRMLIDKYMIN